MKEKKCVVCGSMIAKVCNAHRVWANECSCDSKDTSWACVKDFEHEQKVKK